MKSANSAFDRYAEPYNVANVLTKDFTLDEDLYREYSPLIIGPIFVMAYAMSFAALTSIIFHIALYNGAEIWQRAKLAKNQDADIHLKLMNKYKEAPEWWFMGVFLISVRSNAYIMGHLDLTCSSSPLQSLHPKDTIPTSLHGL